jgi:transcriptional regulator with XRE-family HTH domain
MNKAKKHDSAILERVARRITPELSEQNDRRMGLAVKIANILHERGITNQEFAYMMGKKPSEISRWLSGTHNFTTETLWQIERTLKVQLLTSSPVEPNDVYNELKTLISDEVQKALHSILTHQKQLT